MNSNAKSAIFGGLAATFVVAAAFAPRLVADPQNEVLMRPSATEATIGSEPPPVETSSTTVSTATSTTTTTRPATTTTTTPTTTTTTTLIPPQVIEKQPLVTVSMNKSTDPNLFTVDLTATLPLPGLQAEVRAVPAWTISPGTVAHQIQAARFYTVTFEPEATTATLTVSAAEFTAEHFSGLPVEYATSIMGFTWQGGSHGPVTSIHMMQQQQS